jgi:photosystem II stability/assembly factor-like uncharacterized protein
MQSIKSFFFVVVAVFVSFATSGCSSPSSPSKPEAGQWVRVYQGGQYFQTYDFVVSGSNFIAGTDSGALLTTDNGSSWTTVDSGLVSPRIGSFAQIGGRLFAISGDGIYLSTNSGSSWKPLTGVTTPVVSVLAVSGRNLLAGDAEGYFYFSADYGATWGSGFTATPLGEAITALAVIGDKIFVGCYDGVFLSADNGVSWKATNMTHFVSCLAVGGTTLYAGTVYNDILRSTDNGTIWSNASGGLSTFEKVHAIVPSGSNLFAALEVGGVYLSTDQGSNWTSVNYGLPSDPVYKRTVTALSVSGSNLFAGGNDSGIWRSPISELVK